MQHEAHPERFPRGMPTPGLLPTAVWINKPVSVGCPVETDAPGCPRTDDLDLGRVRSTPEFGAIASGWEDDMLAMLH